MPNIQYKDLLGAGVHFGHLTRKWNPKMASYIFMERNGIHIIDLNQTIRELENANNSIRNIVKAGRKVMFVATKKQAKEIVANEATRLRMPFVTERWLGGMLTNFATVRKSLKKMTSIDKMMKDEAYKNMAKRERLMLTREKEKLQKILGGISDLTRLPAAIFVIDINRESIAISEAKKLGIPVFGLVDTNANPFQIDYSIPGNDDSFKSIEIIVKTVGKAIEEGLIERKKEREEAKVKAEEDQKIAMEHSEEAESEKS